MPPQILAPSLAHGAAQREKLAAQPLIVSEDDYAMLERLRWAVSSHIYDAAYVPPPAAETPADRELRRLQRFLGYILRGALPNDDVKGSLIAESAAAKAAIAAAQGAGGEGEATAGRPQSAAQASGSGAASAQGTEPGDVALGSGDVAAGSGAVAAGSGTEAAGSGVVGAGSGDVVAASEDVDEARLRELIERGDVAVPDALEERALRTRLATQSDGGEALGRARRASASSPWAAPVLANSGAGRDGVETGLLRAGERPLIWSDLAQSIGMVVPSGTLYTTADRAAALGHGREGVEKRIQEAKEWRFENQPRKPTPGDMRLQVNVYNMMSSAQPPPDEFVPPITAHERARRRASIIR